MAKKTRTFDENYRAAVRKVMADRSIESLKDMAEALGMKYMTFYKIMDGSSRPTPDQIILLCKKFKLSANFIMLNTGEIFQEHEATLQTLQASIDELKAKLKR